MFDSRRAAAGAERTRASEQLAASGSTVPIIFITAHDDADARTEALNSGATDFLEKPFDDEELLTAIHTALEVDT